MTHKDIYTKFMIEYDKANVTSSYPSLTEYEVATVLDKAYNALIAQKITGNNIRRTVFETDVKAIADLEPLVARADINMEQDTDVTNALKGALPSNLLYFIQAYMTQQVSGTPMDGVQKRDLPVILVSHEIATKFFASAYNLPWIKIPVCYIENGNLHVVHDPINPPFTGPNMDCDIVYIKQPNTFAKDLQNPQSGWVSYFDWSGNTVPAAYQFECNSTVAEELISLAVAFALENVESQRLNAKLNMRGLEG